MTLILSNEDAEKVLTMRGAIDALEELYRDLGLKVQRCQPATHLICLRPPWRRSAPTYRQHTNSRRSMARYRGFKPPPFELPPTLSLFRSLVAAEYRRIKGSRGNRRKVCWSRFPLSAHRPGELIAIVQDGLLQRFTVGAINAIGAQHIWRGKMPPSLV